MAQNAMIREIAGIAPGHFRGVCPVPAPLLVRNRAAEKVLFRGVYRHDQRQTGRKNAGLIYERE